MASLQDLYAQLGLNPLMTGPPQPPMPLMGAQPYTPYDSTVPPTAAMGMPYIGAPAAPVEAAPAEEIAPVTAQPYGSLPQPRAALPRPLTAGPGSDMFGDYRDIYSQPEAEPDPLAALLGGQSAASPPNRLLSPQASRPPAYGAGAGQQQIERQAAQYAGPTPGEQALLRRNPRAYAPAIARIRDLDRMRAAKGM